MYNILVALLALALVGAMLAKRSGRKRRFRKYLKGLIDRTLTPTALAATTMVAVDNADTVDDTTFVSSTRLTVTMRNYTPTQNVGPLIFGLAHSDYSTAEVEEWLELTTGWSQGDLVSQEISKRKCRILGTFSPESTDAVGTVHVLNQGRPITTKLGWMLTEGQTLKYWVYNKGSQAIATTAPAINMVGHANLWPQ